MPLEERSKSSPALLAMNRLLDWVCLKVIFSLHFILISIALTILSWLPSMYLYYNTFFLFLLLWCIHLHKTDRNKVTPSSDVILLSAVLNGTSIALDIILICTTYDLVSQLSRFAPSFVFVIINLVLRPFTTFILIRLYYQGQVQSRSTPVQQNSSSLSSAVRKILLLDANQFEGNSRPYHEEQTRINESKRSAQLRPVISLSSGGSRTHVTNLPVLPPSLLQMQASSVSAPKADSISLASSISLSIPAPELAAVEHNNHQNSSNEPEVETTVQSVPTPTPRKSPPTSNRQSTYIDPETGEAFQERMI